MVDTFHNMASLLRLDCSHCSHKDSARLDSMLCSLCSASHSQDGTKSDIKLAKLRPFICCLGARTRRTYTHTKPKQETKHEAEVHTKRKEEWERAQQRESAPQEHCMLCVGAAGSFSAATVAAAATSAAAASSAAAAAFYLNFHTQVGLASAASRLHLNGFIRHEDCFVS